jgi:hypothetical protein
LRSVNSLVVTVSNGNLGGRGDWGTGRRGNKQQRATSEIVSK